MKPDTSLRSPDGLDWVQDRDQVLIVDMRQQVSHQLRGTEAIVWSWLASAYSYPKMTRLLANLLTVSPAEAEKQLQAFLSQWLRAGLLENG
jgi:hypothetical protein